MLHATAGVGICLLDRRALEVARWRFALPVIAASILPDFDVLPGLLIGDPNRFHAACSHSLGFAAIAAALIAIVNRLQRWRVMCWVFVAWSVHCLFDSMTPDGRPPLGIPLLWPLSDSTFRAPWLIFPEFRHGHNGATATQFAAEILSFGNLAVILYEMTIGLMIIVACAAIGQLARSRRSIAGRITCQEDLT